MHECLIDVMLDVHNVADQFERHDSPDVPTPAVTNVTYDADGARDRND